MKEMSRDPHRCCLPQENNDSQNYSHRTKNRKWIHKTTMAMIPMKNKMRQREMRVEMFCLPGFFEGRSRIENRK